MDPIIRAGTFDVTVGGVTFTLRRRSTAVMAKARGFMAVVGQVSADPAAAVDDKQALGIAESVLRAFIVSPAVAPPGEPTIEGVQYAYEDLAPFVDVLLVEFMQSGLTVDPTVPS